MTPTRTGARREDSSGEGGLEPEELTLDKVIREGLTEEVPCGRRPE